MNQIQQGDVILKRVEEIPGGSKQVSRDDGAIILAKGEHTGHAHRIFDIDAVFYEKEGKFYLKNKKTVSLSHEEHNHIELEPGIWQVGQIQEKDWLSGMIMDVKD